MSMPTIYSLKQELLLLAHSVNKLTPVDIDAIEARVSTSQHETDQSAQIAELQRNTSALTITCAALQKTQTEQAATIAAMQKTITTLTAKLKL